MARPLIAVIAAAALLPTVVAAGCGGSGSPAGTTTPATTAAPATSTGAGTTTTATRGSTVDVAADPNGQWAYVQTSLAAKAGKITFNFTNDSTTQHNFTLEKAGTSNVLGATNTISGGSTSLTLTLAPGTYTYFCTIPGHEAAGMKGTLTVT